MIDGVDFKLDGMEALREKFQRLRGNGGRRVITRMIFLPCLVFFALVFAVGN